MEKSYQALAWVLLVSALVFLVWGLGMGSGMMGFGMGFGALFMVLFWVALIWFVVVLVGRTSKDGDALELLEARYAKGKLSKKQFEQMKRDIEGEAEDV